MAFAGSFVSSPKGPYVRWGRPVEVESKDTAGHRMGKTFFDASGKRRDCSPKRYVLPAAGAQESGALKKFRRPRSQGARDSPRDFVSTKHRLQKERGGDDDQDAQEGKGGEKRSRVASRRPSLPWAKEMTRSKSDADLKKKGGENSLVHKYEAYA